MNKNLSESANNYLRFPRPGKREVLPCKFCATQLDLTLAYFVIDERLLEIMNIPVLHDEQHGTAIVTRAALLNEEERTKQLALSYR